MKSQSKLFVSSTHKTKTWWMFLSVLILVFVPFLIVWLLNGEFNLIGCDWLVAKGASVWHGTVSETNIDLLVERFHKFWDPTLGDMRSVLSQHMGGTPISIDSFKTFFNPIVLAPLLGLLAWSFIWPICFNATKISGLDVLPFSFGIGTFMIVLIISGLMDQWGQSMLPVYWLVRIVIAAACTFVIFLVCNYFTNKYMANRPYAVDIFFGYKEIDKGNASAKQQLQDNIDIYKKQSQQEEEYVEVEKK